MKKSNIRISDIIQKSFNQFRKFDRNLITFSKINCKLGKLKFNFIPRTALLKCFAIQFTEWETY